ncbi:MAG: DUF362 domain-containing protein [Spirochaetota bacterium]|nr:DUF362 domain-containing protein [Spirochaetota bacterium]
MKEKVYLTRTSRDGDYSVNSLRNIIESKNLFDFISEMDMVAIKTHFGEKKELGYLKPPFIRMIGELVKEKKAKPFLTETTALYKGRRNNAVDHIELANDHGFGYDNTGLPIVMSDGLFGDEETEIDIPGKIQSKVKIASMLEKIQAMIIISHFTGHMLAGFGAALKNMGMGCSSRKGKMQQHSSVKPRIKKPKCTKCELCVKWCPESAIAMEEDSAVIDQARCIGCGQCLAVCRFDAVRYNWGASQEEVQKNIVEHAWGVARANENKILYINSLLNISKDCDCMLTYENISPDIGILISNDPVAIDAASIDLVEKESGKRLSEIAHNINYRIQIDYAKEIGFGNPDYELIETT